MIQISTYKSKADIDGGSAMNSNSTGASFGTIGSDSLMGSFIGGLVNRTEGFHEKNTLRNHN